MCGNMPHIPFYTLIGKPVLEKYGRFKGRIIAFELDNDGNLKNIIFENGGIILSKDKSSFEFYDKYVIYLPTIIKRSKDVIDELRTLILHLNTLKKIMDIEPYSKFIYTYYERLKDKYYNLKKVIEEYSKKLNNRKNRIEGNIENLRGAIFNLHLGRENDLVDQSTYKMAYETLSNEILRYTSEIEDIEHISIEVSSLKSKIERLFDEISSNIESIGGRLYEEKEVEYS